MIGRFILAFFIFGELFIHYKYWGRDRVEVTKVDKVGFRSLLAFIFDVVIISTGIIFW
jgi:hypothetical protein